MKFTWGFGKEEMEFEVPDHLHLGTVEGVAVEPLPDLEGSLREALENPIASPPLEELVNPNAVKVVVDARDRALYFSRATIPWPREQFMQGADRMPAGGDWSRHIGIYAYRTGFLHRYVTWEPAPLERLEQLEQLRALYNGVGIHVARAIEPVPGGVDTANDLEAVRSMFAEGDPA